MVPLAKAARKAAEASPLPSGEPTPMAQVPVAGAVHVHADGVEMAVVAEGQHVRGARRPLVLPAHPGIADVGVGHPAPAERQDGPARSHLPGEGVAIQAAPVAEMAGRDPCARGGAAAVRSGVESERASAAIYAASGR